jgi:hypothetical protein
MRPLLKSCKQNIVSGLADFCDRSKSGPEGPLKSVTKIYPGFLSPGTIWPFFGEDASRLAMYYMVKVAWQTGIPIIHIDMTRKERAQINSEILAILSGGKISPSQIVFNSAEHEILPELEEAVERAGKITGKYFVIRCDTLAEVKSELDVFRIKFSEIIASGLKFLCILDILNISGYECEELVGNDFSIWANYSSPDSNSKFFGSISRVGIGENRNNLFKLDLPDDRYVNLMEKNCRWTEENASS